MWEGFIPFGAGVNVNHFSFRFDPTVIVRKAGVSPDSADYMISRNRCLDATLKDPIEDDAKIFAASGNEADGLEVALEGAVVDVIVFGNLGDGEPIPVFLFHFVAVRVMADAAFSCMALDVSRNMCLFRMMRDAWRR